MTVSSLSEVLAYTTAGIILRSAGIKRTFIKCFLLASVCMAVLTVSKSKSQWFVSVLLLGAKFGISAGYSMVFVGNTLLFPVSIIAQTYGVCELFSKFITILSPYVAEIKPEILPESIFIGMCFLAMLCATRI